jgi:hypothetical protein
VYGVESVLAVEHTYNIYIQHITHINTYLHTYTYNTHRKYSNHYKYKTYRRCLLDSGVHVVQHTTHTYIHHIHRYT